MGFQKKPDKTAHLYFYITTHRVFGFFRVLFEKTHLGWGFPIKPGVFPTLI